VKIQKIETITTLLLLVPFVHAYKARRHVRQRTSPSRAHRRSNPYRRAMNRQHKMVRIGFERFRYISKHSNSKNNYHNNIYDNNNNGNIKIHQRTINQTNKQKCPTINNIQQSCLPITIGHAMKRNIAQNTGVIDNNIDSTKRVDCLTQKTSLQ
jgi:hypothetical protein